jgi:hypothetical protein
VSELVAGEKKNRTGITHDGNREAPRYLDDGGL